MTVADEFLEAASKEYEEGQIDQMLWSRASAQSPNDLDLAIAGYLRARATALQLQKRDRRLARRERRAKLRQEAAKPGIETKPPPESPPAAKAGVRLGGLQAKPKHLAAAAAAIASVAAAVWMIASPPAGDSTASARAANAPPSAKRTPPRAPAPGAQAVAAGPKGSVDDSGPTIDATVRELKDAGNWNVLVLYASKWTRDEPNNAAAWKELSIGYTNLHQFDEAAVAAARAAELAPGDALLWRNLGHLNMTLDRLLEAGLSFERALMITADDADALCGAALATYKLGRTKEADEIAKRVDSAHGPCPGLSDGESVAVVVHPITQARSAPKVRR